MGSKAQENGDSVFRVVGLVDLHWDGIRELRWPDLRDVDLVLLGGDMTNFKGIDQARRVVESLEEMVPRVLAVCGNCDLPEIEGYLRERGIDLDRRARVEGGACFVGLSAGLPFGGCPYERTEGEYREACRQAWEQASSAETSGPTVLVSHQPPFGTRCDKASGTYVGSSAIRECIEEHQPDLVFCGHIHEAIGRDEIGRTPIVNPGPYFRGGVLRFSVRDDALVLE